MISTHKRSGRPKTVLGTAKSSRIISKLNAVTSSTRLFPSIRIVQILSPQFYETDEANFLALVQKLTGKNSAPKKLTLTVGSKRSDSIDFNQSTVTAQSAVNHSHALGVVDEHSFLKKVNGKKYDVVAPLAANERDSLEENGMQVCDSFSEHFGELGNFDFLSTLRDSWPTLPESSMIYSPTAEENDYIGAFLRP